MGPSYSMKVGSTVYIIATERDGTRFDDIGTYSADISAEEDGGVICAVAEPGTFKGQKCLIVNATTKGTSSLNVKFDVNGFHLHKGITLTVK